MMRIATIYLLQVITILLISCSKQIFLTNGETIYKTGRNMRGEKMLDKTNSRIKIVTSCKTCHGNNVDKMKSVSIKFSYLSNLNNFTVPYTDSLFYRFLDRDLKSDGRKANIGVIWKMNDQDKKDLLEYLKTL